MPGSSNHISFTKPGSMVVVSRCSSLCKWHMKLLFTFGLLRNYEGHFHGFPNTLLLKWNMYENGFTLVRSVTMIHETYQETPVKIDPKQQHKTPQSAAFALWNWKIRKQLWYQPALQNLFCWKVERLDFAFVAQTICNMTFAWILMVKTDPT